MLTQNSLSPCSSPQAAPRTTSAPPRTATGLRVLIVDDEPPIRDVTSRLLRRFGHAVEVAANGSDALALARADAFDLIICDLNMPGMSGLAVYTALVRENLLGGALFALATGDAGDSRSRESGAIGRLPLLAKPFDLAQLIELVDSVPKASAGDGASR